MWGIEISEGDCTAERWRVKQIDGKKREEDSGGRERGQGGGIDGGEGVDGLEEDSEGEAELEGVGGWVGGRLCWRGWEKKWEKGGWVGEGAEEWYDKTGLCVRQQALLSRDRGIGAKRNNLPAHCEIESRDRITPHVSAHEKSILPLNHVISTVPSTGELVNYIPFGCYGDGILYAS